MLVSKLFVFLVCTTSFEFIKGEQVATRFKSIIPLWDTSHHMLVLYMIP